MTDTVADFAVNMEESQPQTLDDSIINEEVSQTESSGHPEDGGIAKNEHSKCEDTDDEDSNVWEYDSDTYTIYRRKEQSTNLYLSAEVGHPPDAAKEMADAGADARNDDQDQHGSRQINQNESIGVQDPFYDFLDNFIKNQDTLLHGSAQIGHSGSVKVLIDAGADVNARNNTQDTPLLKSAREGHSDPDTVKVLIDAGADVHAKNYINNTPLHGSTWGGHYDTVKVLIDAGADVNARGWNQYTPLHGSTRGGHSDTVKVLIDAGADVHARSNDQDTPLHESAMGGHADTVKVLIDAGADVNAKNDDQDTPLHESATGGHSDTVKVLIDAGADVNARNDDQDTPLHNSAEEGHSDTVKVLIDAGADVHARGWNQDTPLHGSTRGGHSDIVKVLIDAGADVHARDDDQDTPLHVSAWGGHSDAVKVLMDAGADVTQKNKKGLMPIYLAIEGGHTQTVHELIKNTTTSDPDELSTLHHLSLEAKVDILEIMCQNTSIHKACGKNKRTLLHIGALLGCSELVRYLSSCPGVDVNLRDDFGYNPLHCALQTGNEETIQELLEAGCDVHQLDATEKSVLHHAAINGHHDLTDLFIEKYKLDPYLTDVDNRNCLHYAVIYRREEVVGLLMEKYSDSLKDTRDSKNKTPIDYLHECEKDSLISKYLNGTGGVTVFELSETRTPAPATEEFPAHIENVPGLSNISKQPYVGAVTKIMGHDNDKFIHYVKGKVQQVIREAIPESDKIEVTGVGSSFERSKNGMPDEFDFLVKLASWEPKNEHEGYGKMGRISYGDENIRAVGSHGMWMWSRLVDYWSNCTSKDKTIHTDDNRSFCTLTPPQRHPNRKTCTTWIWLYSDEMFTDLPVSIDLVPAVEADIYRLRGRATWMMTKHEIERKKCYVVPKLPYCNSEVTKQFEPKDLTRLGRVSYPTLEVEHIKALDYRVKDVFITAKCVRKVEVCGFKIKNDKGNVQSVSELVTSYRLKSVFLHLVELFLKSDMSLGKMVLMVYEHLEKCLERDKLPMFFNPKINVLAGSKLSTEESLQVTRIMTRFVRCLYERDVSPEQRQRDSSEEVLGLKRVRAEYEMELDECTHREYSDSEEEDEDEPIVNPLLFYS